jgi:hypothetical protein
MGGWVAAFDAVVDIIDVVVVFEGVEDAVVDDVVVLDDVVVDVRVVGVVHVVSVVDDSTAKSLSEEGEMHSSH